MPASGPVDVRGNSVAVLGHAASGRQGRIVGRTPPPVRPCRRLRATAITVIITTPAPPGHHRNGRHGGTGSSAGSSTLPLSSVTASGSLPLAVASVAGVLALAGGVTVSMLLVARRTARIR